MKRIKNTLWQTLCVSGALCIVSCASGESFETGYYSDDGLRRPSLNPSPTALDDDDSGLVNDFEKQQFSRITTEANLATELSVMNERLNFVDFDGKARLRTRDLGSGSEVRSIILSSYPSDSAIDANNVYLSLAQHRKIRAVAHGSRTLRSLYATDSDPLVMAVDGEYVFWGEEDGCTYRGFTSGVDAPTLMGCIDGVPTAMAASAGEVFWSSNQGTIFKATRPGAISKIARSENVATNIVVDGQDIVWADDVVNELRSVDRNGGEITILAGDVNATSSLAVDARNIYATSKSSGTVWQLSKESMRIKTLASEQRTPFELAQDRAKIYWINKNAGEILSYEK